jgi:hypothetical protein
MRCALLSSGLGRAASGSRRRRTQDVLDDALHAPLLAYRTSTEGLGIAAGENDSERESDLIPESASSFAMAARVRSSGDTSGLEGSDLRFAGIAPYGPVVFSVYPWGLPEDAWRRSTLWWVRGPTASNHGGRQCLTNPSLGRKPVKRYDSG